jgi:hypothetical protein
MYSRWRRLWISGGMILTWENWSNQRKICSSALYVTSPAASGSKAGLRVEGTFTNRLRHTGRSVHESKLYRGSTNFSKNPQATSQFQAPEWWHFKYPQILGATSQNLGVRANWLPGFVHPCIIHTQKLRPHLTENTVLPLHNCRPMVCRDIMGV